MKRITTKLEDIPWVCHGFFTRHINQTGVAEDLGVPLVTLKQIHSSRVITVTTPWSSEEKPEADALVTSTPGLGLAVFTADCVPILFSSAKDKIVGAAHAGWKGAIGGVLEATVAAMQKLGAKPEDITAAIGPCIGPKSYEVSDDFKKPFLEQNPDNIHFFAKAKKKGHLMFDLPGYTAHRLKIAGINTIYDTARDTLVDEKTFCSYRRSCLKGEVDAGRQLSVIGII